MKTFATLGQGIFNPRRYFGKGFTANQTVLVQTPKGGRQYALRNIRNGALQILEAQRLAPVPKRMLYQQRPLVPYPRQHIADRAMRYHISA